MEKFNQKEYINQYNAEHYEQLIIRITKGKKAEIKQRAERKGLSLNAYINQLIDNDIEKAGE